MIIAFMVGLVLGYLLRPKQNKPEFPEPIDSALLLKALRMKR